MWLKNPDLAKFVEDKLVGYLCKGWGSFVFKEKLKFFKGDIKAWSVEKFEELEKKIAMSWTKIRKAGICLWRSVRK